jgi:hypothetical protein
MTASETFEQRIVSVANTGSDATATKVVCITNGDLLRYKTLLPLITSYTYTGVFNPSMASEIITLVLPIGLKYEDILNINLRAYYDTNLNTYFKNGLCWANDQESTIYYASGSNDNPSTSATFNNVYLFKMYRRANRMPNAPYRLTILYYAL